MTREQLVLAALAASNGATHTPVQVQKLVFLIQKRVGVPIAGPWFNFEPYDYGPFDAAVYDALDHWDSQGMVETITSPNLRWKKYRATVEGSQEGQRILSSLDHSSADYIRELSAWVRRLSFADLVSSIYSEYPEMREHSIFQG